MTTKKICVCPSNTVRFEKSCKSSCPNYSTLNNGVCTCNDNFVANGDICTCSHFFNGKCYTECPSYSELKFDGNFECKDGYKQSGDLCLRESSYPTDGAKFFLSHLHDTFVGYYLLINLFLLFNHFQMIKLILIQMQMKTKFQTENEIE